MEEKKEAKKEEKKEAPVVKQEEGKKEISDNELNQASGGYPSERSDVRGPKPRM